jgi:glycosyltransferase involved in cell wall biosynthesis
MFLRAARLLGYKLIWTAHNVLPHTPVTVNDVAVRKLLVRCCSRIIVPSTSTIADLAAHGITAVSCVVIPHGSYIGVYPNTVSVQQARRTLNIPAHARVIGFFGAIHPYKNIPELVRAFVELAARDAELYMVLAGKCSDARVDSMVAEANATCGNRLRLQAEYIPDSGVQLYLNAADVMVFPFSRVTTSGSILLASSFGKPVVAPRIGVLQDMPDTIGVLYDPTAKVALAAHIGQVLDDPATARHMGAASYKYAAALSWETIAAQTGQVYAGAVRGR